MFTDEEVKTAKYTRQVVIEENITELKAIYMAGEICMWDDMRKKLQEKEKELSTLKDENDLVRKQKIAIQKKMDELLDKYEPGIVREYKGA